MAATCDPELADQFLLQLSLWQEDLADQSREVRLEHLVQLASQAVARMRLGDVDALWDALEARLGFGDSPVEMSRAAVPSTVRQTPQELAAALVSDWASLDPNAQTGIRRSLTEGGVCAKPSPGPAARGGAATAVPRERSALELAEELAGRADQLSPAEREAIIRRLQPANPKPEAGTGPAPGSGGDRVPVEALDQAFFSSMPAAERRVPTAEAGAMLCLLLNSLARLCAEASETWASYEGERKFARPPRLDGGWLAKELRSVAKGKGLESFVKEVELRLALVEAELRFFRFVVDADSGEPGLVCAPLAELVQRLRPGELEEQAGSTMWSKVDYEKAWKLYRERFRKMVGDGPGPSRLVERLREEAALLMRDHLLEKGWTDCRGD